MATDYYGVLGLARGATDNDIKKAYRRLARDLHPDVNPEPGAKERFQEVSKAYQALTDPEKRRIVDLGGDPLSQGAGTAGNPFSGFGGFGDVFEAFFGGGMGGGRGRRSRVRPGSDALVQMSLTLAGLIVRPVGLPPPPERVQLPSSEPESVYLNTLSVL